MRAGLNIVDVVGRTEDTVKAYATAFEANPVLDITAMDTAVDLVLICVHDDQIAQVETAIPAFDGIIAHTSGAKRMNLDRPSCAVFYPLQTFSKSTPVDFTQVPVLIEAQNDNATLRLMNMAKRLSEHVFTVNSDQRERLHVAAVFANNFSNHMVVQAYKLCQEHNIPFDVLKALILETARKAVQGDPRQVQTGPARRNDQQTITKHLDLLTDDDTRALYKTLTESILKQHEAEL